MGARRIALVLALFAGCGLSATFASARSPPRQSVALDLPSTSLSSALAALARRFRVDLLVDQNLTRGRMSVAVRGRFSIDEALRRMLWGSGLGFRRTSDGVIVLYAVPTDEPDDPGAVAEILVVGRRTQNADIRRTQNDIQPYRVLARREISDAHRDDVDGLLRSRETQNAQIASASQDPIGRSGSNQSEISLRGLGSAQTLILVDGRRLPGLPTLSTSFQQPDVNGIPLGAIERIETLPSTAGGIYGPGATGGVVNIVLRRDYHGAELKLASGITGRGDAGRLRLEGRIGFTSGDGRTDAMVFAGYSLGDALLAGDRVFLQDARARALSNSPSAYLARYPVGNGINVFSASGNLVLDPSLGGASLGSTVTSLPLSGGGAPALIANAGKIVTTLPDDTSGARADLLARPTIYSGILNVRHRFGTSFEAFADLLYMRNEGRSVARLVQLATPIDADAPGNPFGQPIILSYPLPGATERNRTVISTLRATGGVLVDVSHKWRASLDYSWAVASYDMRANLVRPSSDFSAALGSGQPGSGGLPALDPLGDPAGFLTALPSSLVSTTISLHRVNRASEAALRLAGPVARLPGGPLTVTLLGSLRREDVPSAPTRVSSPGLMFATAPAAGFGQSTRSGYAELRAPLLPSDARLAFLRGLEFQLAVRFDAQKTVVPANLNGASQADDGTTALRRNAAVYTAGLRFRPRPWMMLRASIATGRLPPSVDQVGFSSNTIGGYDAFGIGDPKRSGRLIGTEGDFTYLAGGSPALRSERARSLSVGIVLNPDARRAPRVSLDATHIDKHGEISTVYSSNPGYFVAHEALYPGRIQRAPLTASDRAAGFAAGRIIGIDTRALNGGRTMVDALDLQVDWQLSTDIGTFSVGTKVTWEPGLRRRKAADLPLVNLVDFADGPLAWRGSAGLGWANGPFSLGLFGQYFGSYRVANSTFNATARNPQVVAYQGASAIPAQTYLDFSASRRFVVGRGAGPVRSIEVSFGILNLFDHQPPIVANPDAQGYSTYGDPRGRRFELAAVAGF
ncbi:TonB-dependent receptor [Sphingomonas sp.]|uniref:TonB-dependent receptor n=1 Tax=Sphingomonas sp. TaxID=28214 RepID=UPI001B255E2E|nr:TonB-dependent receptor [Sphingomonas sp.]MBO9713390.1 TonB-dependent receptor [Sphingomonas sp.]